MSDVSTFIRVDVPPTGPGCEDCEKIGAWWLHLRRCAFCGHIGCCDDSVHKHATAHVHASEHRVIQSYEPGEDWFYDYGTDTVFDGPHLTPPRSHPRSQTTPGPADRVPRDWEQQLAASA